MMAPCDAHDMQVERKPWDAGPCEAGAGVGRAVSLPVVEVRSQSSFHCRHYWAAMAKVAVAA